MTAVTRRSSAGVDRTIAVAVVDLLGQRGYQALTIDEVAIRAGVAKTAIYRRWSSKAEMVFDLVVHGRSIAPPADTGSVGGDLRALIDPERAVVERILARARDRGEVAAGIDAVHLHAQLLGTIFARVRLIDEGPPAELTDRLSADLLAGARSPTDDEART